MKNVSCTSLDGAMCSPPLHPQLFSVIPHVFVSPMFLGEQVRVSQRQAATGSHPISPSRWKGAGHLVLSLCFAVCLHHTLTQHTRRMTVQRARLEVNVTCRYALELLKATGVCVVPGGGFGQEPGTQHIRLDAVACL